MKILTPVLSMTEEQFAAALDQVTTPQAVYDHAADIYDHMTRATGQNCDDSVLREWAFGWASDELGIEYRDIYDKWLGR